MKTAYKKTEFVYCLNFSFFHQTETKKKKKRDWKNVLCDNFPIFIAIVDKFLQLIFLLFFLNKAISVALNLDKIERSTRVDKEIKNRRK